MWGAVKDRCYAGMPGPIEDNICEAIDEIQVHIIDNVPKNWTDEAAISMKLFSIINRMDCTFK